MKIMRSAEDYLEAMLMLQEKHGYIRSIDIANHLGVTKPSVSYAVKKLRENGYISMADDSRNLVRRLRLLLSCSVCVCHYSPGCASSHSRIRSSASFMLPQLQWLPAISCSSDRIRVVTERAFF